MIEDRPWDTEVTGYRCGTVVNLADLRHRAVWQHLVAFSDADDWTRIRSLEAEGFRLVGCRVEYVRDGWRWTNEHVPLEGAIDEDYPAIEYHAERAFTGSRFHADLLLAPKAGEIHRRWIASARKRGDVRVFRAGGADVVGYVVTSHRDDTTRVDLIGAIKRGAGQHMLNAIGCPVRAKTQASNRAACRMYERAGFLLDGADVVHTWSPGT